MKFPRRDRWSWLTVWALAFLACAWRLPAANAALLATAEATLQTAQQKQRLRVERVHTRAQRRAGGIFQMYDATVESGRCSCSCCIVAPRRPTEAGGESARKCAPPPVNAQRCGERCAMVKDPVLMSERGIMLTERFCFYRCQPGGVLTAADKAVMQHVDDASFRGGFNTETECVPAPQDEVVRMAEDTDGNGRDAQLPPEIEDSDPIRPSLAPEKNELIIDDDP